MKTCDGCNNTFEPLSDKCAYCRYNPLKNIENNYVEETIELFVPKFSINSLKLKASGDWAWSIVEITDDPDNVLFEKHKDNRYNHLYDLLIYSNGIEIKERMMIYNVCWLNESVKIISNSYKLPMDHYDMSRIDK